MSMRRHGSDDRVWTELITADDMNEPSDYEFEFDAHKPCPMIEFELETQGDAEPRVCRISIVYCQDEGDPFHADPISLVRNNFEVGRSDEYRGTPQQTFDSELALRRAKFYNEPQAGDWYQINTWVNLALNSAYCSIRYYRTARTIAELYAPHIKSPLTYLPKGSKSEQCGVDETRTRGLMRDRHAF